MESSADSFLTKARKDDTTAALELAYLHRDLAHRLASEYFRDRNTRAGPPPCIDIDDARQEALLGIAEAARNYRPANAPFLSFAAQHAWHHMCHACDCFQAALTVPPKIGDLLRQTAPAPGTPPHLQADDVQKTGRNAYRPDSRTTIPNILAQIYKNLNDAYRPDSHTPTILAQLLNGTTLPLDGLPINKELTSRLATPPPADHPLDELLQKLLSPQDYTLISGYYSSGMTKAKYAREQKINTWFLAYRLNHALELARRHLYKEDPSLFSPDLRTQIQTTKRPVKPRKKIRTRLHTKQDYRQDIARGKTINVMAAQNGMTISGINSALRRHGLLDAYRQQHPGKKRRY